MTAHQARDQRLAEYIELRMEDQRSVALDSVTSRNTVVHSYVPNSRAVDLVARVAAASAPRPSIRSWTVTGPYGSGKSSFVAFLGALFGNSSCAEHQIARQRLELVSADALDVLDQARVNQKVPDRGYLVALVTCQREPVMAAVIRALSRGAEDYWRGPGRRPRVVRHLRELAAKPSVSVSDAMGVIEELEGYAPLLIALDEFGKAVEYATDDPTRGDLYVLQTIAERFNSASVGSCLLTVQHLALSDYAIGMAAAARQEWAKIQGRFQDVPFQSSPEESVAFIRGHLGHSAWPEAMRRNVRRWASRVAESAERTEAPEIVSISSECAEYYPLHPLVLVLAPLVAHEFAQGDRSLHAWLASDEPNSLAHFLAETAVNSTAVSPYGPERLYDYFLSGLTGTVQGRLDSRSVEVIGRVKEAVDIDDLCGFLLRTVALLNVLGSGGVGLRASYHILAFAATTQGLGDEATVRDALDRLQSLGYVTYRRFADEFRIWQGSDIGVEDRLSILRDRGEYEVHSSLNLLTPLSARVAQRHGHATGTFRYFRAAYCSTATPVSALDAIAGDADGLIAYSFEDGAAGICPTCLSDGRPAVWCVSPDGHRVERALTEVAALDELRRCDDVAADSVAGREVRERLAVATEALAAVLAEAFDPSRSDLVWTAGGSTTKVAGAKDVSTMLSDMCDSVFSGSLALRNELLNRVQLTSQGAKARRVLLGAMVAHPELEAFGIDGFGPERSMYESLFRTHGLHREVRGAWVLGRPPADSPSAGIWVAIDQFVDTTKPGRRPLSELVVLLSEPPYGVRESVSLVLILTYLNARSDEVALYQDGTFEPQITDPMIERFLKAPDRFAARLVADGGARQKVIDVLTLRRGKPAGLVGLRNSSLLSVLRPAFHVVQRLDDYSRYTSRLDTKTQAVRTALLSGRELDELLFTDLPLAVGLQPFGFDDPPSEELAEQFADALVSVLDDLSSAYDSLLYHLADQIALVFRVPPDADLRLHLRERARRVRGKILDNRLRNLVLYATDEVLPQREWLEALCMAMSDKPPNSWRDTDLEVFLSRLKEAGALFARVEHLHTEAAARESADGFTARRVAVTMPDGEELQRVVWSDDSEAERLRELVTQFLDTLPDGASPRVREATLAVLADEVLRAGSRAPSASDTRAVKSDARRTG